MIDIPRVRLEQWDVIVLRTPDGHSYSTWSGSMSYDAVTEYIYRAPRHWADCDYLEF